MNKLLMIALLSFSCVAGKTQCDNTAEQNKPITYIAWQPNPALLPLLDKCYEDKNNQMINNGIMRSAGDLLFNLFGQAAITSQEKEFVKMYSKYLGMYLYFAEQLLFEDDELVEYIKGINLQDYADIFNEETAQVINQVMPGDLFILMNIFLRDAYFQQEVEQFVEMALKQSYQ